MLVTTMMHVAQKAGVSKSTVSQVLNGRAKDFNISNATIERVNQAALDLGYVPNTVARNLRAQRTGQIGVVVAALTDMEQSLQLTFDGAWLLGMSTAARQHGFTSALLLEQPESEPNLNLYYDGRIEGLLLRCDPRHPHPLLANLTPARIPMVAVWTQEAPIGIGYADVDHFGGAEIAIHHLLELGHQKIAFLDSDSDENNNHFRLRYNGYKEALEEAGIRVKTNWHQRSVSAILELIRGKTPVTAVFAANDVRGVELVRELTRVGIRVPEDISVIGFDNIIGAAFLDVELTTIHHPIREMALEAVKNLADLIQGKPYQDCRSIVPTYLVKRKTCAPVKKLK